MLYSHSRLATFEQCPLKFKFHYIDGLEPPDEEQTIEAFLGDLVHRTLEKLYKDMKFQKTNTLEDVLAYYHGLWEKEWNSEIRIVKKDYKEENYKKMGDVFIRAYYARHEPFNHTKTLGLEHRIVIALDGGYQLQGYIDRLSYDPKTDTYEVHDYKTASNLPMNEQLVADRQLALYSIAVREAYRTNRVKLIWHFLAFDKDMVIEKTADEIEELKKDTIHLIKRVEQEKEFKPKVSALCDYCEFRSICPEWKHLYKVEDLPPKEYTQDRGVQLVNAYVELQDKAKTSTAELEEVKAALTDFAKHEGISAVAGSGHRVRIVTYPDIKIPKEKEEEVRALLKEYGLWNDVSRVDSFRLRDIIQSYPYNPEDPNDREWKPWPQELVKKLARLLSRGENVRLYVNRL
ncbi:MAG: PD-(D/E)XK nuclease family protein [Candidatus Aenigmatarchaeota archaeon]|nr:MAG: PD-(D/E)XK nuclease family protein [Candidatus Aenigmarchaeota archaeon]